VASESSGPSDTPQNPAGQLARGEIREAEVKALDLSGVPSIITGIVAWAVAFVVLLFFRGDLERADREWWLWVPVTGFGLGLLGLWYCKRRWAAIQRSHAAEAQSPQASGDDSSSS
jgi:ABC-type nickel/cobalt efflux system permease component RcnA